MTITTGTTRTGRLADRGRTMHVLLEDDLHEWSVRGERHERDHARTLDRIGERALVTRAIPRDAARQNLAAFGHIFAQARRIFIVQVVDFLHAERTDFALRLPVFGCAFL